jgi:hypothetical protein
MYVPQWACLPCHAPNSVISGSLSLSRSIGGGRLSFSMDCNGCQQEVGPEKDGNSRPPSCINIPLQNRNPQSGPLAGDWDWRKVNIPEPAPTRVASEYADI